MVYTSFGLFPTSFALLLPKSFHHIDINSIILAHVIHDAQNIAAEKHIFTKDPATHLSCSEL